MIIPSLLPHHYLLPTPSLPPRHLMITSSVPHDYLLATSSPQVKSQLAAITAVRVAAATEHEEAQERDAVAAASEAAARSLLEAVAAAKAEAERKAEASTAMKVDAAVKELEHRLRTESGAMAAAVQVQVGKGAHPLHPFYVPLHTVAHRYTTFVHRYMSVCAQQSATHVISPAISRQSPEAAPSNGCWQAVADAEERTRARVTSALAADLEARLTRAREELEKQTCAARQREKMLDAIVKK